MPGFDWIYELIISNAPIVERFCKRDFLVLRLFFGQWRERVICFLFLDRMYQELSNGMLGFYNCLKIADVPFPLPYAQLLGLLLIAFSCLIPFYDAWLHPTCEFVHRCHEARDFVSLTPPRSLSSPVLQ